MDTLFCTQLSSLISILSRVHVVNSCSSFFCIVVQFHHMNIPQFMYSYYILLIFGLFQVWTIITKADINSLVQVFWQTYALIGIVDILIQKITLIVKCEGKALAIGSGILRRVRNQRFSWSKFLLSISSFVLHLLFLGCLGLLMGFYRAEGLEW